MSSGELVYACSRQFRLMHRPHKLDLLHTSDDFGGRRQHEKLMRPLRPESDKIDKPRSFAYQKISSKRGGVMGYCSSYTHKHGCTRLGTELEWGLPWSQIFISLTTDSLHHFPQIYTLVTHTLITNPSNNKVTACNMHFSRLLGALILMSFSAVALPTTCKSIVERSVIKVLNKNQTRTAMARR